MYLPAHFAQHDRAALHALVRSHPLATLVTPGEDGLPVADLVPMQLRPGTGGEGAGDELWGHVARANPLWRHADGRPVLVLFHGPQAYVTPSWYPAKARHGKVVPTWNYAVVQARATLHAVQDRDWLRSFVDELTTQHETGRPAPWGIDDAPADFVTQMLGAIVGLRLVVHELVGKWKLSQNRDAADRDGVATGLAGEAASPPSGWTMAALVRNTGGPTDPKA